MSDDRLSATDNSQQAKENQPKKHRIFFALWPDNVLRKAIKKQVQPLLARQRVKKVPLHNWHMTLAFLGNVTAEAKDCSRNCAASVSVPSFTFNLDRFGYFKRTRVAWLGCYDVPDSLNELYHQLNDALAPCGYKPEHASLVPHITLMRKVCQAPPMIDPDPVSWSINEFVLVESEISDKGAVYNVIDRWPLLSD